MNYCKLCQKPEPCECDPNQVDIFSGEELRDISLRQVEAPRPDWVAMAFRLIESLLKGTVFTSDRLWAELPAVNEPRALGAAMMKASRRDLIEGTGRYVKSSRPQCHARPVREWVRL